MCWWVHIACAWDVCMCVYTLFIHYMHTHLCVHVHVHVHMHDCMCIVRHHLAQLTTSPPPPTLNGAVEYTDHQLSHDISHDQTDSALDIEPRSDERPYDPEATPTDTHLPLDSTSGYCITNIILLMRTAFGWKTLS